jgi:cysteine desulfurase
MHIDVSELGVDLLSMSAHKFYGPKGIGALILRRRGFEKIPLTPLIFGGGQEDGYRAGTLAVPLIVGLGRAVTIAFRDHKEREASCQKIRQEVLRFIDKIGGVINGDPAAMISSGINFSIPGVDSEAAILALKDVIAISNGSACTSQSYTPSHVLTAMNLDSARVKGALRFSWSHLTPDVDWELAFSRLKKLL